jgi:hypothetical protein
MPIPAVWKSVVASTRSDRIRTSLLGAITARPRGGVKAATACRAIDLAADFRRWRSAPPTTLLAAILRQSDLVIVATVMPGSRARLLGLLAECKHVLITQFNRPFSDAIRL